jgi:hypothetical protein
MPTEGRPRHRRDWQDGFLAVLRDTGNVRAATQAAGIDRSTPYKRRREDESFAEAWSEAIADAGDVLEAEARRRAVMGVEEPVFYQGVKVGATTRYSDQLLMFLLKAAKPREFSERLEVKLDPGSVRERLVSKIEELASRRAETDDEGDEG